ncbi:hypothetical protein EYF80_012925 [Liparis tanakae]|uniref:Uncharacterized protein n=1 Tax=Liparis tanakae TaxID=230148 RepID=A0A4Z2IHS2_9TELE|nr:hypothetical protein EYF80_012925 [Liparis tanakae]
MSRRFVRSYFQASSALRVEAAAATATDKYKSNKSGGRERWRRRSLSSAPVERRQGSALIRLFGANELQRLTAEEGRNIGAGVGMPGRSGQSLKDACGGEWGKGSALLEVLDINGKAFLLPHWAERRCVPCPHLQLHHLHRKPEQQSALSSQTSAFPPPPPRPG